MVPDHTILTDLVTISMPYGKYQGRLLLDLPEPYLVWMQQKQAWPSGRLGILLQSLLEIRENGLIGLLYEIQRRL